MQGHLWHRQVRELLHGVSMTVGEGEAVAYLGPNGAGKTTTFRAICGLSTHVYGDILWRGKSIDGQALHRKIGFLPEGPYFYRSLTPQEMLLGLGRLSGLGHVETVSRINELAEELDFSAVLDQSMRTCSKGQLQRIGLAQAMLRKPELLILDEPMSGLDPLGRERVREVLQTMVEGGMAMLFSSHVLADAEVLCHRVVALHEGRIIFSGQLEELAEYAGHGRIRMRGNLSDEGWPVDVALQTGPDGSTILRFRGGESEMRKLLQHCTALPEVILLEAGFEKQRLEDAFVQLVRHSDGKND